MTIQIPQTRPGEREKRSRIVWFMAVVALLTGLTSFSIGHLRIAENYFLPKWSIGQVVGESMAPSLMGARWKLDCPTCQIKVMIPAKNSAPVGPSPENHMRCWHCGASISKELIRTSGTLVPGDSVHIDSQTRSFEIGDSVAIDVDRRMRVKRILAVPGDVVSLEGSRLCVRGKRFPVSLPLVQVDSDRYRSESRWEPCRDADASNWNRVNRTWVFELSTQSVSTEQPEQADDWLCYHHRSVYRHNQISPVMDDYPINTSIVRRLNPVEHLALEVIVFDDHQLASQQPIRLETLFWGPGGVRRSETSLVPGTATLIRASTPSQANVGQFSELTSLVDAVAATHPIAIRFVDGVNQRRRIELNVLREIEYRVRPHDDTAGFPILLAEDQYYVVGDNVPVSIDSRTFGPIKTNQIIGKVERTNRVE